MTLKLRSLKVIGFLGYHSEASVNFGTGVTAIIGENGAGKSSLVDAIYYSLTQPQQTIRANRKSDLINRRSTRARIVLELENPLNDNEVYIIESILDKMGSSQVILKRNGRVEASGSREVREKLAEILGVERARLETVVGSSIVVRQGGLDNLIYLLSSGENKERVKFFENVFGLNEYSKARDLMGELNVVEVKIKNTIYTFAPSKTWRRDLERIRSRLVKEKNDIEMKLREIQNLIPSLREKVELLDKEVISLREKVNELNRLRGEMKVLNLNKKEIEAKLSDLRRDLIEKTRMLDEIERRISESSKIISCAHLYQQVIQYHEKSSELSRTLWELEKLVNIKESIETIVKYEGVEKEYLSLKAKLDEMRRTYRSKERELGETEGRIKETERRLGKISKTIIELIKRYENILGPDIERRGLKELASMLSDKLRSSLLDLNDEIRKTENMLREVTQEKLLLKNREDQIERSMEMLISSSEPKCPLCGSPLTSKRKEEILKSFRREVKEIEEKIKRLELTEVDLLHELEKLQVKKEKLSIDIKNIEDSLEEIKYSSDLLKSLKSKRDELKSLLRTLENEILNIENKLEELYDKVQNYRRARENVRKINSEYLNDPLRSLKELSSKIYELQKKARLLESTIDTIKEKLKVSCSTPSAEEAIKLVEEAVKRKSEDDELRAKKIELNNEIAKLKTLINNEERKLEETREKLAVIEEKLEKLRGVEEIYVQKLNEYKKVSTTLVRMERDLESLSNSLEEVRESLKNLEEAKFKLEVLTYIREVIFEKVPRMLFLEYIARLEDLVSEIMSKFDLNYTSIVAKVDKDSVNFIAVGRDGVPSPLGSLSGGERTAIGLAFVLALNVLLAKRIGFLVLDEPTNNLDDERRRILIEVIKSFKGGGRIPQLVVVTHDNDIIEAADVVFEVRRTSRGSIIRPLQEPPKVRE